MIPTIRVAATVEDLALQAAERFVAAAEEAVVTTGRFAVGLSGGSTPIHLFRLLAGDFAARVPWDKTHVLFVDERCVGPDNPESNFGMACRELLDHVPIDYTRVYRMAGEKDPQVAADAYEQVLQQNFSKGLDLAVLGIGDDGHTASLFPRTAALAETKRFCVANFVPKSELWRLTLTAPYLNMSYEVMVLAAGAGKADAINHALAGTASASDCPIRLISPKSGRMVWLMDAQAAGMDADESGDEDSLEDFDENDESGIV